MSITLIADPTTLDLDLATTAAHGLEVPGPLGHRSDEVDYDPDPVIVAVQRQAGAAARAARAVDAPVDPRTVDPQAWLFAERARYRREGTCDPYAMLMLLRAGMLPTT